MAPGDLHRADVPFVDGSGKKNRIVLIVKELEDNEVLVVESRGAPHRNLELIGIVDFSRRGYAGLRVGGVSHFYANNLRILDKSCILPRPVGGLTPADFRVFFNKIDDLLRKQERFST